MSISSFNLQTIRNQLRKGSSTILPNTIAVEYLVIGGGGGGGASGPGGWVGGGGGGAGPSAAGGSGLVIIRYPV